MNTLYFFDLTGTLVFAISGALSGRGKHLDPFGLFVVGFVTAVGGGTLRDLLIGNTPVGWMRDMNYLIVIIAGVSVTFLLPQFLGKMRRTLFLFDTIGIAVFTVLGMQKTLELGLHPLIAVMMGTVSAVFGGIIRDTLTNEIPLIFRKEIYALACFFGGLLSLGMGYLGVASVVNMFITIAVIIGVRLVAIKYNLSLPRFGPH